MLSTSPQVQAQAAQPSAQPPVAQHIHLELAIYKRYNRQGQLYTAEDDQGRPMVYRFTVQQARVLLQETAEDGRPIWRRPIKRVTQRQVEIDRNTPVVADVTTDRVQVLDQPVRHPDEPAIQRLDDTDPEFEALLDAEVREDSLAGDVSVGTVTV